QTGRYGLSVFVAGVSTFIVATPPEFIAPASAAVNGGSVTPGATSPLNIVFSDPVSSTPLHRGPVGSTSHTPQFPQPWTSAISPAPDANHAAAIEVITRGTTELPTNHQLIVLDAVPLVAGQIVAPSDIVITPAGTPIDVPAIVERTVSYQ